jgi:glyoxylate reductase
MLKPKVFVTRVIPQSGLELIQKNCDAIVWPGELPPTHTELMKNVLGVQGLLCLLTDKVDNEIIEAEPKLRTISNMAVGVDNIDTTTATRLGIPVGNTPGVLTDATADFTITLMMATGRRVVEATQFVRQGHWRTWGPQLLLGADFSGATLGIIGFGRIGQAVAKRAQGFGMSVIYHDPSVKPVYDAIQVKLEEIFQKADFISLHVPLTDTTRQLINARTLEMCKSNAILINTSRGGVVDHAALASALESKQIFAAALDVTDPEPLPLDHPLMKLDNCIVTPHIASASRNTRGKMAEMAAENLLAGLAGERIQNCVNPEVYEKKFVEW